MQIDWPRFIEPLFYPVGWFWLFLLLLAFIFLLKRKWAAAFASVLLISLIFVIGSTRLPYHLLATLEKPYLRDSDDSLPQADAVVVLGGMLIPSRHDPFQFQFIGAMDRIITGLELIRQKQAPVLVLGGGGGWRSDQTKWSEAELLERWFEAWQLPETRHIALAPSRNTREEALHLQQLLREEGWQRILLVTSGYHMKRALATFNHLKITADPYACDFIGLSTLEKGLPYGPFPRIDGFHNFEIYLREQIGWVYYRTKDWIQPEVPTAED